MPITSLGVRQQRGHYNRIKEEKNIIYNDVVESIVREQGFMEY